MDKILNNLGLCMKASSLVCGTDIVCESLRGGHVCYIFLANDASDNTKKKILDKSKFYNVEVNMEYTSLELSKALGKSGRMVVGITNEKFLKILKK